jgi:hypothetical protein
MNRSVPFLFKYLTFCQYYRNNYAEILQYLTLQWYGIRSILRVFRFPLTYLDLYQTFSACVLAPDVTTNVYKDD